jgi:catechol 2,3-dioxygenase-like lactoylglutathione lyase family enzyme
MSAETVVQHVALVCRQRQTADQFFIDILGMPVVKTTRLSQELSRIIFGIDESVEMVVYGAGSTRIEVFIHSKTSEHSFDHVGLEVPDKAMFFSRCEVSGLKPFWVQKEGRQLLFVRDYSGNLFEITEPKT